jgi:hypothetical protein
MIHWIAPDQVMALIDEVAAEAAETVIEPSMPSEVEARTAT